MPRSLLSKIIGHFRTKRPEHHVLVYSREDCCLCDVAWKQLQRARQRFHFTLEKTDIASDADLQARFGDQVPVVCVDGELRFRGRINEVLLERLLQARSDRRPG
jgi:hypothetical protein